MAGRTVPLGWRVQIADKYATIFLTIPFAMLVFAESDPDTYAAGPQVARIVEPDAIELTKATILSARKSRTEIRQGLDQLWAQLRTLAKVNVELGRERTPANL
jgi:hypothetical protein